MSNTSLHSTIENLSTELWCEIFEFFDVFELFHTFDNINSRITSILSENTALYFNITTIKDYDFASYVILPKINNPANVKSFKIDQEFQIEEFFTLWPFRTFSQLRCLSLVYVDALMNDCSIDMLEQLSHLKYLESLHVQLGCISKYDKCLKRLLQLIFVENHVFNSLKRFVFQNNNNKWRLVEIPTSAKQTRLELITLPSLYLANFLQLLPCIPHMRSITINRLFSDYDRTTAVIMPLSNVILSNCVDLNLDLDYHMTYEDVELLLQKVPHLHQLKLTCNYVLIHGERWKLLLQENCSQLQKFEIFFSPSQYFFGLPRMDELQSSFSTPFWLQRNVQFEHSEQFHHTIVRFKI